MRCVIIAAISSALLTSCSRPETERLSRPTSENPNAVPPEGDAALERNRQVVMPHYVRGSNSLTQVAADDIAMPTLTEWQQKVVASYQRWGAVEAQFSPWYELASPTLKQLFPGFRFFVVSYSEIAVPGKEKFHGLAQGLSFTVVCQTDGRFVKRFTHWGNYEQFGDVLAAQKVAITSAEDATLVWHAFCDLHQLHSKDLPAIKISDTVWHLGDNTIDGVHYYHEVTLDSAQTVTSSELRADDPKRPKSK